MTCQDGYPPKRWPEAQFEEVGLEWWEAMDSNESQIEDVRLEWRKWVDSDEGRIDKVGLEW
jgi:hypothetical protein